MSNRPLSIPASLFILLALPAALAGQEREPRPLSSGLRTIKVVGVAEASVVPDLAVLMVSVETRGTTASESMATNAKGMTSLLDVLKKKGIEIDEIQTAELSLSPLFEKPKPGVTEVQPPDDPKIVGYTTSNRIGIYIRDTKRVGEVIDLMVSAGLKQIHNLSFSVSEKKPILRELRKQAIADAREKASEGAKNSGMILGLPISLEIQDENSRAYASTSNLMGLLSVDRQATPIATGRQALQVSAVVVYELKAPQ